MDIFNGDADGLCGITQLRLAQPKKSSVITGVKRDNALLEQVMLFGVSQVTVVDISLHTNRDALSKTLAAGCMVEWFDHHHPGEIPNHPNLIAHIETHPNVCSSLIINTHLNGRFQNWAITGAFGDNLDQSARELAASGSLSIKSIEVLQELGNCINYNSYGESVEDLHYHPEELYCLMQQFDEPMSMVAETEVLQALKTYYNEDLSRARKVLTQTVNENVAIVVLPNTKWSRRINGIYANELANNFPKRAHAILVEKEKGYTVSIRAPKSNPTHAQQVALKFDTGGGRHAAAGIQHLPTDQLIRLTKELTRQYLSS
ncbi:MAG: DHH family phosphoesterase [Proteobacteria bacterium]|nr:DHH family phosphoesterase [Pseudomonadota bacterium]